jgi:hypothetical protein
MHAELNTITTTMSNIALSHLCVTVHHFYGVACNSSHYIIRSEQRGIGEGRVVRRKTGDEYGRKGRKRVRERVKLFQ